MGDLVILDYGTEIKYMFDVISDGAHPRSDNNNNNVGTLLGLLNPSFPAFGCVKTVATSNIAKRAVGTFDFKVHIPITTQETLVPITTQETLVENGSRGE